MKTENEILKNKLLIAVDSLQLLKNKHNEAFIDSVLDQLEIKEKLNLELFRRSGVL